MGPYWVQAVEYNYAAYNIANFWDNFVPKYSSL